MEVSAAFIDYPYFLWLYLTEQSSKEKCHSPYRYHCPYHISYPDTLLEDYHAGQQYEYRC